MYGSLLLKTGALAFALNTASAATVYTVTDTYAGSTFFDGWNFNTVRIMKCLSMETVTKIDIG